MTRPGKWRKSYKHQQRNKPKTDANVLKRRKNIASLQRAKEMQEYHRKHLLCVKNHQQQSINPEDELVESAEEENPYDELVSELAKNAPTMRINEGAISSSSDDDEENEDDNDDEEIEEEAEDDEEELDGEEEAEMEAVDDTEGEEEELDDSDLDDSDLDVPAENEQSDSEDDLEDEEEDKNGNNSEESHQADTFSSHVDYELPAEEVEKLLASNAIAQKIALHWPSLGECCLEIPQIERPAAQMLRSKEIRKMPQELQTTDALQSLGIKPALANNVPLPFNQLQSEMLTLLNNYYDVFYPQRTFERTDELRTVYCLHALNHMLKTRTRILHHNSKLTAAAIAVAAKDSKKNKKKKPNKADLIVPDSYRDQGLVRPRVLIVLPFRESAYHVVSTFKQLLYGSEEKKVNPNAVMHYDRFVEEYTGQTLHLSKTNPKPEDYERIFQGNTDDNFRIGMSLTKKCLRLYTDFYASDIIIASPLGLRMIIGAAGSKERDYDFLNSIELLIIDQTELLFAQNWENLIHLTEHLHLQPQSLRDADFQRVRPWCLSGLSRFYRQTVLLATHELPEFRALFNNKCCNYAGKLRINNHIEIGNIRNVAVPIPQVFHHVPVTDLELAFDQRFRYFTQEVLPRFRNPAFSHCMIYVPSYFDYVRLRNYLKAETISFVQICEYTNKAKMARARDIFYHSGAHFMLYSERSHFYRRTRIKGIRHLIMYQPPLWPHFYAEMINLMHTGNQNIKDGLEDSMSITVLYTKYDLLQLKAVLGSDAAVQLVKSNKSMHTFTAK